VVLHLLGGRHPQDVRHARAGNLHLDPVVDALALDVSGHLTTLDATDHHAGLGVVELRDRPGRCGSS
jgi:hypothetical protein